MSAQVVPGRTFRVNGASGPDGSRKCTVTASVALPGLKMSTSEVPPVTSCAWGMAHCDWARGTPGTRERPPGAPPGPTSSCTADATTRPVLVETTVLRVAISCTSVVTFSTAT